MNLQGAGAAWSGTDFPPYQPVVHLATWVSSALVLGLAMVWPIGKRPSTVDLSLADGQLGNLIPREPHPKH